MTTFDNNRLMTTNVVIKIDYYIIENQIVEKILFSLKE